jgi:hypothetical protein
MSSKEDILKKLAPLEQSLFERSGSGPEKLPTLSAKEKMYDLEQRSIGTTEDPFGLDGLDSLFKTREERTGDRMYLDSDPFEIAARSQTSGEQLVNGLGKATINTAATFLGGTAGIAAGVLSGFNNWMDEDEASGFWDGFINNGFNDTLDGFTESMQQALPNLRTKEQQNMGAFESMGTMNFWADDFANGVSFTVGALLTEAAYSALTVGSLGTLSGLQGAGTARLMLQGAKVFNKAKASGFGATKAALKIAQPTNQIARLTRQVFTGAGYESAFEARHGYNEMIDVALSQMREENPGKVFTEADIDPAKMEKITAATNALFAGNLALVSASNFIAFGKTFKTPKLADARRRINASKLAKGEDGSWAPVAKTAFEKAKLTTMFLTKGALSEGFMEEGGQSLMSKMAVNHITRSKDPEYAKSTYDLLQGFTDAFEEAKGDKAFHKEILIGSLIGSMGNSISSPKSILKENAFTNIRKIWSDENSELSEVLDQINNSKLDAFLQSNVKTMNTLASLEKEYIAAMDKNDIAAAKDAESEMLFTYMFGRFTMGLDSAIEGDLQNIQNMSVKEFRENFMKNGEFTDTQVKNRRDEVVASTRKKVEKFGVAINEAQTGFMGQSEDVIRGAAYLFYEQQQVEERYRSMGETLLEKFGDVSKEDLDKLAKAGTKKEIGEKTKDLLEKKSSLEKRLFRLQNKKRKTNDPGYLKESERIQSQVKELEDQITAISKSIEDQFKESELFSRLQEFGEKDYTKAEKLEDIIEGVSLQMKLREELRDRTDIPTYERDDLGEIFDDFVYIYRKKKTMDKFLNGFFDKKARTKFSEQVDEGAKKANDFLIDAIEELQYSSVITNAELGAAVDVIQSQNEMTPIEFNKSFIARIGQLLKQEKQGKTSEKIEEEPTSEEVPGNVPPINPTVVDQTPEQKEAELNDEEKEAAGEEIESKDPSARTKFVNWETFFRINSKMDEIYILDPKTKRPISLRPEFQETDPDYIKNRNENKNFIFYRALYSLHKIKVGETDHMLTDSSGNLINSQKDLLFRTYTKADKGLDPGLFKVGKNPIVVRLEKKDGTPVKVNGKDVTSWLPEATYTTQSEGDEVYTRFDFSSFVTELAGEFNIGMLGDFSTLDKRIEEATGEDRILFPLKKELEKYKKARRDILDGQQSEFPVSAISFNPGVLVDRSNTERTSVLEIFGSWEKFKKALDEGRIEIQAVKGYNKDAKGRSVPTFSNSDKVLGGKIIGAPGQVHLIIDKVSYRLDKEFIGDSGLDDIRNIIESTQKSLILYRAELARVKSEGTAEIVMDQMELPFITTREGLEKEGKVDIGSYIRDIAGVSMLKMDDFTVVNKNLVLNKQKRDLIEKRNFVYLSTVYATKDGKMGAFSNYTSGYVFHYKDKAGKYATKSFDDIIRQPENKKSNLKTPGEKATFNRELLKEILNNARYRAPVDSQDKGLNTPIKKMGSYDQEEGVFNVGEVTFAEHFFKGEQKAKVIGTPTFSEEKPTVDDFITNMKVLSPSIQLNSTPEIQSTGTGAETEEQGSSDLKGSIASLRKNKKGTPEKRPSTRPADEKGTNIEDVLAEQAEEQVPDAEDLIGTDLTEYQKEQMEKLEGFVITETYDEVVFDAPPTRPKGKPAIPGAVSSQEADYGTSIDAELQKLLKAFRKTIEPEYKKGDYQKVKSLAYRQINQNKKGVTAPDMSDAENLQLLSNYPGLFEETIKALEVKQKTLDAFDKEKVKAGKENLVPVYVLNSSLNKNTGRLDLTWVQASLEDVRDKTGLELSDYTFQQLITYDEFLKQDYNERANASPEIEGTKAQQTSEVEVVVTNEKYSRNSLDNDSSSMYLFTDNAERTSRPTASSPNITEGWYAEKYKDKTNKPLHFGSTSNPTSAVIRGKNNAYPISTMSAYGTNWTNENFDLFKTTIDDEIAQIKKDLSKFKTLKLGNFRIGQGGRFAKLPSQHQSYLDSKLLELGIDNSGNNPKVSKPTQQTSKPSGSNPLDKYKRRVSRKTDSTPLSDAEKAWFKKTFPNIETEYGTLESGVAAMIANGKVLISRDASGKTLYHEGFHIYLRATHDSQEALNATLAKVQEELGDRVIQTQKGKKVVFLKASEATLDQIEEYLAEEYGTYLQVGENYNFPSKSVKSLFQRIWEAIKKVLGISQQEEKGLEYLFRDLSAGKVYSIDRTQLEKSIPGVAYRLDPEIASYINVVHGLFFDKLREKETVEGQMYTDMTSLLKPEFYQEFSDFITELAPFFEEKGWGAVVENKEALLDYHREVLANLDIQEFDDFLEQLDLREAGRDNTDFEDKSGVSALNRASKPLKIFLLDQSDLYSTHRLGILLSNSLESSASPEEAMRRLKEMSENVKFGPEYQRFLKNVYDKLSEPSTKEMSAIYRDFYTTFSQSKTETSYVLVGKTGSIVNSTSKQTADNIKRAWLKNANSKLGQEDLTIIKKEGQLILDPEIWETLDERTKKPIANRNQWDTQNKVLFWFNEGLGLDITKDEYLRNPRVFQEFLDYLGQTARENRGKDLDTRLDSLFNDEGTGSAQLAGRVAPIIEIMKETRPLQMELSAYSQGGKKRYAISLSTLAHRLPAFVRQGSKIFDSPARSRSLLYQKMKENDMKVYEITGMDSTGSSSSAFHNLDATSQAYVSIEAIMNGLMLMPSDGRNTIRAIDVRETGYDTINEDIFVDRMMEHLKIEMYEYKAYHKSSRVLKKKQESFKEGLHVFKEIDVKTTRGLSKLLKTMDPDSAIKAIGEDRIRDYMKDHLDFLKSNLEGYMKENGLIEETSTKNKRSGAVRKKKTVRLNLKSFAANKFGTDVSTTAEKFVVSKKNNFEIRDGNAEAEKVFDKFLTYVAGNQFLFSLDASVVYAGGMYGYKDVEDMFKRHSRITSPQMNNAIGERSLNELDEYYARSPKKMGKDSSGQHKRRAFKTVTVKEPVKKSQLKKGDLDIADAFSWISYDSYRDMRLQVGRWNNADEQLYQYNMQTLFRMGIARKSDPFYTAKNFNIMFKGHAIYEDHLEARWQNRPIKESRPQEARDPEDNSIYLSEISVSTEIEKPHGIGPATYNDGTIVDNHMMKTAMMPITYLEHSSDPWLIDLSLDMLATGVDLVQTESSNKGDYSVDKAGNAPELFSQNEKGIYTYKKGTLSSSDLQYHVASFPAELFSIQQDPSRESDYITLSVQLNSLVKSDFLHRLSGEEKEKIEKLSKRADAILTAVRKKAFDSVKRELGIVDGRIPRENWKRLKGMLLSASSNKNTPDSTRYAIENLLDSESTLFKNKKSLNMDYSSMGEKLSTILTSVVEDRVVKLKSPGAQLVQVPNILYGTDLKFYRKGKSKTYQAEVMINFPKKLVPWMLKNYGSLDNFNKKLKEGNLDNATEKILTNLVGNRVPTSGMNLIESFKVVKFLHWTAGKKIVLPDGMTEKAGSDFDIDKLTTYFDALDILDGKIVSFSPKDPFQRVTEEDFQLYYRLLENKNTRLKQKLNSGERIKKDEVEDLFNSPLIEEIITMTKYASFELQTLYYEYKSIPESEKYLDVGRIEDLKSAMKYFVLPPVEIVITPNRTYADLLPNKYLMNSLKDIYNEFITHEGNYDALTDPLSMDIFSKFIKVAKKVAAAKEGMNWNGKEYTDNLRAFDLVQSLERKWRFVAGTSDLGITARALSAQGILSSSEKAIRTSLKSIFKDIDGNYILGKDRIDENYSVIEVLNQLAQAQLEIEKDPTLAYANLMGTMNIIFQSMIRVSPQGGTVPINTWMTFITSDTVVNMTKEATKRSSEIVRMKGSKGSYKSFPGALSEIAGKYALSSGFDTNPLSETFDLEALEKGISQLDIKSSDLADPEWLKNNEDKVASILLFYYNLASQVSEVDKHIYQDASFASGFSGVNLAVLSAEDFQKEPGKGSNLIWNKEDLKSLNDNNRTGFIEEMTKEFSETLLSTKTRGLSPIIHERLNEMVRSLPRSRKRDAAAKKIELLFMSYVVHNNLPDLQKYPQILSTTFVRKIEALKKANPGHPVWDKIDPIENRILKTENRRAISNTVILSTGVEDVNELNILHSRLLLQPDILKDLALLAMGKSGFLYQYQGLAPLLPEDFLMELYLPAHKSFEQYIANSSQEEIEAELNRMEDTIMSNVTVATDTSMVTSLKEDLVPEKEIPGVSSRLLYGLSAKGTHLLGTTKSVTDQEDGTVTDGRSYKLKRLLFKELVMSLENPGEIGTMFEDSEGFAKYQDPAFDRPLNVYSAVDLRGEKDLLALIPGYEYLTTALESTSRKVSTEENIKKGETETDSNKKTRSYVSEVDSSVKEIFTSLGNGAVMKQLFRHERLIETLYKYPGTTEFVPGVCKKS